MALLSVHAQTAGSVTEAPNNIVQGAYSRGAEPMVTWEPWFDDQSTTLDQIINGSQDAYIEEWASAAKNYGKRIYLRPMHEMNGYWYP